MLNVVWFTRDLRITDHLPLTRAVNDGIVVPLYIAEPEQWELPTSSARQWRFVARALAALRANLAVAGAPLVFRVGDPVEVLDQLRTGSKDVVLWTYQGAPDAYSTARDRRVQDWAGAYGVPWHRFALEEDADFESYLAGDALPAPEAMLAHGTTPGKIVSERILYLDEDPCEDAPASPINAERLLAELATGDAPQDVLARLSPHLTHGTLSPREMWQRMQDAPAHMRDALGAALRERWVATPDEKPDRIGEAAPGSALDQMITGRTGWPLVDAAMRSLTVTGTLRRDLKDLCLHCAAAMGIDPQAFGTALARLSVDYDPVTYWARVAAGSAQSAAEIPDLTERARAIDPSGQMISQWVPELDGLAPDEIHTPSPAERAARGYPSALNIIG